MPPQWNLVHAAISLVSPQHNAGPLFTILLGIECAENLLFFFFFKFNCSAKWELVYVVRYIYRVGSVTRFFKYMHAYCGFTGVSLSELHTSESNAGFFRSVNSSCLF